MESGYCGSTMVNNFSGNVVATQPLLSVGGTRMPVSIELVYNTYFLDNPNLADDYVGDTYLGQGWKLNYQMFLLPSQVSPNEYPYVFVDGDGTRHYIYKDETGKMMDEDGFGYTLTIGTSIGAKYTLTDKQGWKMIFNNDGLLKEIKDTNNNSICYRLGWAVLLLLYTGMRRSELWALEWDEKDITEEVIRIHKNTVEVRGKLINQNTTKTKSGNRDIPL